MITKFYLAVDTIFGIIGRLFVLAFIFVIAAGWLGGFVVFLKYLWIPYWTSTCPVDPCLGGIFDTTGVP